MIRILLLTTGFILVFPCYAEWQFNAPLTVTSTDKKGVFHHLESSGRKNIAVSSNAVAVIWEDNHTGTPSIYAAFLKQDKETFTEPVKLSSNIPAYEPSITDIGNDRFVATWEASGKIQLRLLSPGNLGNITTLDGNGLQPTLASGQNQVYLSWSHKEDKFHRIVISSLAIEKSGIKNSPLQYVDIKPARDEQFYSSIAITQDGVVVAWEDRRHGHTRLYTAFRAHKAKEFSEPRQLNEIQEMKDQKYGRGSGVTRVALATDNKQKVVATWLDKRDFRHAYDVYAAISNDAGRSFGANEKAQDLFGNNQPQWHPSVAVSENGITIVAWDDSRDDTPDIWFSWRNQDGWNDDETLPTMSGNGQQVHPTLCFDNKGQLHLAWINHDAAGSRILYLKGEPVHKK